jgi:16S rRNA (cytidine1402-2'-O)-methyltransferase
MKVRSSARRKRQNAFVRYSIGSVGKAGPNVIRRQPGIGVEKVIDSCPLRQFAQQKFHSQARSADHGLTLHDGSVDLEAISHDSIVPIGGLYTRVMPGLLYVVSTPIGNLEDITYRAVRILKEVDWIACEDTRTTKRLLDHYGIQTRSLSYHEHNESSRTEDLVARLQQGEKGALVSDAGTPLLSDPGYRIVRAAVQAGIRIEALPGASAVLTGLVVSGLPTDQFHFGGFLPPKQGQRTRVLESLRDEAATLIFYEAPHRIVESLEDIGAVLGDREVVVARELTKLHEEVLRGTAGEIRATLESRDSIRGEFVVLIAKCSEPVHDDTPPEEAVEALVRAGVNRMDAMKAIARQRGLSKRDVYKLVSNRSRT